ncbi:MAG: hypothetical protein GXO65_07480 [Euryarchaeota archaeon]|nr:hypothetical protein [Euryarchaeota archaeon]
MGALGTRYKGDVTTTRASSSVPAWDEWFTLKNTLSTSLKSNSIAATSTIFEVPEGNTERTSVPVWLIDEEFGDPLHLPLVQGQSG